MKWALTSPDGLGDFLLRFPWLFAMEQAGWELTLLARQPTLELAMLAGLRGRMVPLGSSPYSKETRRLRDPFRRERLIAQESDLVFLGPSQPSFFEEELGAKLDGPRLGGFVLDESFWPSEGISDPSRLADRYEIRVKVRNDDSEPVRNARAASTLLGKDVKLRPFRFPDAARSRWFSNKAGGRYTVTCPGYREGDYFTGLGAGRWITELRHIEKDTRFVFTGSPAEVQANAAIRAGLSAPEAHLDITGQLASLSELLAILDGADAYVGKDSGTMHLAAALDKPVVAVFGGGHWSRFLPTGTRGVVLTAIVPCRRCDWRCHLPEPVCVTGLPEGAVGEGFKLLSTLAPDEIRLMEYPADERVDALLGTNPGKGFPERVHRERRQRLTAEREECLMPPLQRLWRRTARRFT